MQIRRIVCTRYASFTLSRPLTDAISTSQRRARSPDEYARKPRLFGKQIAPPRYWYIVHQVTVDFA
jgi:hypothetical protein